jgi:hypothetical protein
MRKLLAIIVALATGNMTIALDFLPQASEAIIIVKIIDKKSNYFIHVF